MSMTHKGPPARPHRALLRYARPFPGLSALVTMTVVLYATLTVSVSFVIKSLFDAIPGQDDAVLYQHIGALFGLVIVAAALWGVRVVVLSKLAARVGRTLRERIFSTLLTQSIGDAARGSDTKTLDLFSRHVSVVEQFYQVVIGRMGSATWTGTLGLAGLFVIHWQLALLTIVSITGVTALMTVSATRAKTRSSERERAREPLLRILRNVVSLPLVVRTFRLEAYWTDAYRRLEQDFESHSEQTFAAGLLAQALTVLGSVTTQCFVIVTGAVLMFRGDLSMGDLLGFLSLMTLLVDVLFTLGENMPDVIRALESAEQLETFLGSTSRSEPESGVEAPLVTGQLSLEHVSFAYGDTTILRDLSLIIPHGASVAFVGPSGSGKSTALGILLGVLRPGSGRYLIDETDTAQVDVGSLQRQLGAVFQDTTLFEMSIGDNIRMGRLDASHQDIEAAAREAEIHDDIVSLPLGYDTMLGPDCRLSGGQTQRVAIARALLRDPRVLLLDEATSALDPTTEAAVVHTLHRCRARRTMISVTHRLHGAVSCDKIFVFDQGAVVEQGTHEELLQAGGLYRTLFDNQSGIELGAPGQPVSVKPSWLRAVPLFENLSAEMLAELSARLVTEHWPKDVCVVREGEQGDRMYFVARGLLAVTTGDQDGAPGLRRKLRDGAFFGEIALLYHRPRSATVRVMEPSILLSLSKQHFQQLLRDHPTVRLSIQAEASERVSR